VKRREESRGDVDLLLKVLRKVLCGWALSSLEMERKGKIKEKKREEMIFLSTSLTEEHEWHNLI
jgi:hypothetical protein